MITGLQAIAASLASPIERRLFAEYGAVFVTTAIPPPAIVFSSAADVDEFQKSLPVSRGLVGQHEISLQSAAMAALEKAAAQIRQQGGQITARAADSGGRSYDDTVNLWLRNVTRGLQHWQEAGRMDAGRAEKISGLSPAEQVGIILNLEETEHLYFGTYFDKSILYSVAAPGASQHLSLLAFDVAEYQEARVETALAKHGWHRTVPNDLPHFTYLGHSLDVLPTLGLVHIERQYGDRPYGFWVPDLARLDLRHP